MHSHVTRKVAVEADSRFLGLVLGLGWVEGDRLGWLANRLSPYKGWSAGRIGMVSACQQPPLVALQ
jgi:hypothetical protein